MAKYAHNHNHPPLVLFLLSKQIKITQLGELWNVTSQRANKMVFEPHRSLNLMQIALLAALTNCTLKKIIGLCFHENVRFAGRWYDESTPNYNTIPDPNFFEEPPPPNYGKYKGDESV